MELGLEAINFALAEKQYADLMELLGNFSAFTRSSKYRKFRPNTAPGEVRLRVVCVCVCVCVGVCVCVRLQPHRSQT